MASKKTDAQIIKGLETCAGLTGKSCSGCPYWVNVNRSQCRQMYRDVLGLIQRQQAELDELRAEKKTKKKSKEGAADEQRAEQ